LQGALFRKNIMHLCTDADAIRMYGSQKSFGPLMNSAGSLFYFRVVCV
jgi:hypothetical protein